jgi:bidirectional [NiFe] hydrogenase diaphorase subunit
MFPYLQKCDPPSGDKRWKIIAATMRKLGNQRHALIEALHSLQQSFGYLDKPGLTYVAASLKIPLSRVYGVATFYNHFTLKPQGEHACVVCTGTACYIKGARELLKSVNAQQGIGPGETTPDGNLSVLTARCFGACGLAPAIARTGVSARASK